jgi:hypothetical protein
MEDEALFAARSHRARVREHDQQEGLTSLGLSEVEAVEYVLMLSRDEAKERAGNEGSASLDGSHDVDEGVFEGDFEGDASMPTLTSPDIFASGISVSSIVSSHSSGSNASFSSGRSSTTTSPVTGLGLGRPIPGAARVMGMPKFGPSSSSSTNHKVQVSPRERVEPLEAGAEWREGGSRAEIEEGTRLGLEDHSFPPVGGTSKNERWGVDPTGVVDPSPRTSSPKANKNRSSVASRSAWSTPLTKKLSLSPPNMADRVPDTSTPSRSAASIGPAVSSGSVRVSPTTNRSPFIGGVGFGASIRVEEIVDEDLRFALELSLAEAKSGKEDV